MEKTHSSLYTCLIETILWILEESNKRLKMVFLFHLKNEAGMVVPLKVGLEIETSKEMVSRWETGERMPSPYYQDKLCILFGMSAADLGTGFFSSFSRLSASLPSRSSHECDFLVSIT